ncbi:hypothetical protein D3C72_1806270 [compost metagenome]
MQTEQPRAFDKKPHFIFTMGVFGKKLLAQHFALGVVRTHADHIPTLVALFRHQTINFMLVSGNHRRRFRVVTQFTIGLPAFKTHADLCQLQLNSFGIAALPQRLLRLFIAENRQSTHEANSPKSM